jgi:phage shock protein C
MGRDKGGAMDRKLYRSGENRVLAGICGGIGEYFNIDPVLVRILWVIFTLMGGSGIIGYIIALFVIPKRH